jgi:hypothetical protein
MNAHGVDNPALPQSEKQGPLDSKLVAEAFLELFELLQEYAPPWYTEQQHNRALAAHRILQKPGGMDT